MSASAESPQLLVVDYDGKILYNLKWYEGRYVTDRHLKAATSIHKEVDPASAAKPVPSSASTPGNSEKSPQETARFALLTAMSEKFKDIENAVLTNSEGQVLSALHQERSGELATVAVLAWSFLQHTAEILGSGRMREISLRDTNRFLVMYPLVQNMMFSVVAPATVNLERLEAVGSEIAEKINTTLTH